MKSICNDVKIRRYEPSDLIQLREVFTAGMKMSNAPDSYIEKAIKSDLSCIEDTYFSGRGSFFVMERLSDATIVGMVGLQDLTSCIEMGANNNVTEEKKDNNFCELRRMSIHASERRKGRGKELVEFFIRYARDNGFDGIKLSTGGWMNHAISFYLSVGFKDDGRLEFEHQGKKYLVAKFKYSFT